MRFYNFYNHLNEEDNETAYLLETTDNIFEIVENLKSSIEEYKEYQIDKSQMINLINEIKQELDKLEDNL